MCVFFRVSDAAFRSGWSLSARIVSRTRFRTASLTRPVPFSTWETVAIDTPAARATS
ncbi:MAG: hypothetical protein KM312_12715 [Hydrogenibacillus schlegelii]|uniref:Uncharacterized protein n=1 Tax=Hydrogenibacillus schlegelii TaxID=1484 RepID=A0A947CZ88_HYDSH|nr:hypothetical protein [Hydrogenibacillus schlegelii]